MEENKLAKNSNILNHHNRNVQNHINFWQFRHAEWSEIAIVVVKYVYRGQRPLAGV